MTDEELAGKLEEHAKHGSHAYPALLYASADRIHALSAHVAMLKTSLAQADREAEKRSTSPSDDDPATRDEYRGMFHAAVSSLASISDALGVDPDEGGAEPILAAIKELKAEHQAAASAEPAALPLGFLSDVLTAAGLVEHGRQCKDLAKRLGSAVLEIRSSRKPEPQPDSVPELEREACADAESDAGRLALELECLLHSISDMPTVSRWWESANEALDLHRSRLDSIRARGAKGGE